LLVDGRPYICGRRFTAADVTFAALGGPMVAPSQYGAWLPVIEECPTDMAKTMQCLRKSTAGKHILKIYETKRHQSQETGPRAMCQVG
jgi:glutathione S-transferase